MVNVKYYLAVIKYNIKIIFNHNILASIFIVLISPLLFNFEQLNYKDIAIIGEIYLVIIGILLLPYLTGIEYINNICEITRSKVLNNSVIYILRLLVTIVILIILILIPIALAYNHSGSFPLIEIWLGISISALYFGLVGLTITNIFSNTIAGYFVAFSYYMFELFTRGKFTGKLYALSLLKTSFAEKYYLLAFCVVLLCVNYFIVKKRN
ncbi:hypothetical protein IMX26_00280 [Clostridium sp. 'deep sea']|uniref:hypothetical protein n=1 Tax=Clostridium sp. 'deep sea' TaxID=2779445 RepID=UPI00189647B7|nr:hypothetical protein [Clostridium sp. 'deep sea']QOR35314.1 hypothetical protein IMX26_00280 [Clostridium sp. 'deep sea']